MFTSFLSRAGWSALALACTLGSAWGQALHVDDAWTRATVPGQRAGSAFMTLQSDVDATLTGVSSPVAEHAEIHVMEQDGDIMRMRALPELPLPAGQPVALTFSGTHVMLMNLHQPLVEGSRIQLTLQGRTAAGESLEQVVELPVLGITARGNGHDHDQHHDHHDH